MEIRIATVNVYIDMPTPFYDRVLSYLEERVAEHMPSTEPAEPAPPPSLDPLVAEVKQAAERLRYRTTQPIRTGPKPEPSAHDLIMQMEGHDVDDDIQPDESWLDEWPDEATISKPRPNPYDMPL
jgi:hypothetical protein